MSRTRSAAVVALVARFPQAGRVKTRLAPVLGAEGAAELHRELAAHCVARMHPLAVTGEARVEVHHDGGSVPALREWLGDWPRFVPQVEGDLGVRLRTALAHAFASGAWAAIVLGSDCPCARTGHVRAALRQLRERDAVIGPAEDGGYWLLGVTAKAAPRALPALFAGIRWGGDGVLRQTLQRAADAGLDVGLADRLGDVDRPEDLASWRAERARELAPPRSVSVVIPAVDEATRIGASVASAIDGGAHEVIVVDGGSTDRTRRLAEDAGARVIDAHRGRARQMNAGAAIARGDALVFLHADTRLPTGSAELVCETLASHGTSGGAFTWATDDTRLAPLFNWAGRLRVAVFRVPYGDQALFMRRRVFEDLGGYPEQPVMEDWELAQRLRRLGRLRVVPDRTLTSSRRWTEAGVLRPTLAYLGIIAGYRLGIDPAVLDGWRRP